MRIIRATAWIEHGKLMIETLAPADLIPGEHTVVIQVDERPTPHQPLVLPTAWAWNSDSDRSFGREELYGDDGR